MAEGLRCRLVRYLEHLTLEELKKFKLYLQDVPGWGIPRGRMEGTGPTEVAELLFSFLGEKEAWELALRVWKMMGQRELWERAQAERLQGTTEESRLKTIQDARTDYQYYIREKFQHIKDRNSRPGEHEIFQHRFTELLCLQNYHYKDQKSHELLLYGWEHAEVMEERGKLIDVSSLFAPDPETSDPPKTVVLQGAAGIGKTTLARKVMLDWAEGKLYQKRFKWVFYLSCRELNPLGERETSFADLIANDWPGPQAPMIEIMSQPEKLLFIIDGLDELKFPCNEHRYDLCKDWKQQRPVLILLSSLLRKTLLPKASLLLTTRLTALGKFHSLLQTPRHVEILGFSKEQRKEYFCKFFGDEYLGKKAFNAVEDNITLFTMCCVPLMNWIICTCLKQQIERGQEPVQTLKTTTAFYMCYLSSLILPDEKNFEPQHLRGLCCLAAEGIWERKLLFEEEDLRRHGLQAIDVSAFLDLNIFQKDIVCENCYSFIHLSFQEFFAAMFYVMPSTKEEMEISDSSIPDVKTLLDIFSQCAGGFVVLVVCFLFGFLNTETAKELERKFKCRISPEIKSQLLQWTKRIIKTDELLQSHDLYFPEWYSHLYETQDDEFVSQALTNIQEITVNAYLICDALAAVFCIKNCRKAWRISFSYVFDLPAPVWQDFFSEISKNQNLKEFTLSGNSFLYSSAKTHSVKQKRLFCELELLNSNQSLENLHVNRIVFEDDGMKLTYENLENKNCQLQTLRINYSQNACFPAFSSAFLNESLKNLYLSFNYLGEEEMKLLCKTLEKQECQLQTLSLVSCEITPLGYQNLFSSLYINKSLKKLDLGLNSFQEMEIKLLGNILENPDCKLETLSLVSCEMIPVGYQNLFYALLTNEKLKILNLSENSFEQGEIKVLCNVLENPNCKLETLRMTKCKFPDDCCHHLISTLLKNENLKDLELSPSSFEPSAMKALSEALRSQNSKLQRLRFEREFGVNEPKIKKHCNLL